MRTMVLFLLAGAITLGLGACSTDKAAFSQETPDDEGDELQKPDVSQIKIIAGGVSFTATLAANAAAAGFVGLLPMTVDMREMGGNEKYYYLPLGLRTSVYVPESIGNGDLMLYGEDCLVLFYKTFSSSYSYTRIGTIDDPSGLENALGGGNATVTFELIKNE